MNTAMALAVLPALIAGLKQYMYQAVETQLVYEFIDALQLYQDTVYKQLKKFNCHEFPCKHGYLLIARGNNAAPIMPASFPSSALIIGGTPICSAA